jgi:hypothetical protein
VGLAENNFVNVLFPLIGLGKKFADKTVAMR